DATVDAIGVEPAQARIQQRRAIALAAPVGADADGAELAPGAGQAVGIETLDRPHGVLKGQHTAAVYPSLGHKHHIIGDAPAVPDVLLIFIAPTTRKLAVEEIEDRL